ncbi:MAG: RNA recognition motif domain-containing protein [Patescibacteria group bacterium]
MFTSQDSTNQAQDPSKLYVGNLVYSLTEEELSDMFGQYGQVEECKLITDFRTGRSKGFAFVKFASAEDAAKAMEQLNDQDVQGRKLFIKIAQPPKPREDRGDRGGFRGGDRRGGFGGRSGGFDRSRRDR